MTEETYRRLMLKHAAQQTALLFTILSNGNNLNIVECIIQCKKECEELDKETDEALKEIYIHGPDPEKPHDGPHEPMRWW